MLKDARAFAMQLSMMKCEGEPHHYITAFGRQMLNYVRVDLPGYVQEDAVTVLMFLSQSDF